MNYENKFWNDVRRKRDAVFLWWLAWIPVQTLLGSGYRRLFQHPPSTSLMWAALLSWACVSFLLTHRLVTLPCPRCGQHAFHHIFFRMRRARCRHCGFSLNSG